MRKQQIDYIFTSMLESYDNVSDLNFTVDKPLQVEAAGELKPVTVTPPRESADSFSDGDHRPESLGRRSAADP